MTWDHTDRPVTDVTDLQAAGVAMDPRATVHTAHQPYGVVVELTTIWQPATASEDRAGMVLRGLTATRREAAACLLEADACLTQALVWRDDVNAGRAEATRRWAGAVLARVDALLSEWDVRA